MVAEPLVIEFHEDNRLPVVARMETMAAARTGWVNLTPGLDLDFPPAQRSAMAALFGARGPEVPLATWAPPDKRDRQPSTIGIQHAQGPRIADILADLGFGIPDEWRMLQDHPKRGLVCAVPSAVTTEELDLVLGWLLQAAGALCPHPRTGEWRAICYHAI